MGYKDPTKQHTANSEANTANFEMTNKKAKNGDQ